MTTVKSVPLEKLKVFGHWAHAPLGAILQAEDNSDRSMIVGMRCELKVTGVPLPCFLVLGGPNRGLLLEAGRLRGPALDVSSIFEVRVADLRLTPLTQDFYEVYGIVCEHQAGSGHFLVRAKMQSGARAFVWLRDPSGNEPTGTATTEAVPDLLVVGAIGVSELPNDRQP